MDRRGNYFMAHEGQIGFNPLQILGLSAIHPKAMQHSFVDVNVNTHSVENDFSLFSCKDQDINIVNMKNNLLSNNISIPVGNGFSKLIGGFIGSKCLIGSSGNRENNFWGRVFKQYNSIIGSSSHQHVTMSVMDTKENTGEFIKASAVDAAILFSHSFDLLSRNSFISQNQKANTGNSPQSQTPVETQKQEVNTESSPSNQNCVKIPNETQVQEVAATMPKQSYAEVAKAAAASKFQSCPGSDKYNMNPRRLRSVRRNPSRSSQKDHHPGNMQHSNWRNRNSCNVLDKKDANRAEFSKELHRQQRPYYRGNEQKCTLTSSAKEIHCASTDHRVNSAKAKQPGCFPYNRKPPLNRRLKLNLLSDIKEDCQDMINDMVTSERNNYSHNPTHNKGLLTSTDQRSVPAYCQNWRCRPNRLLCDPCKMKDNCHDFIPEQAVSNSEHVDLLCEAESKESNMEDGVSEVSTPPCSERKGENYTSKQTDTQGSSPDEDEAFVLRGCPIMRTRISSVCSVDSEDSFIIMFDSNSVDSGEEDTMETASLCDSDNSDDESDTSDMSSDGDDASCLSSDDDGASSVSSQCSNLTCEDITGNDEVDSDCVMHLRHDGDDYTEIDCIDYLSESKLKEANAKWDNVHGTITCAERKPKKVQFAKSPKLASVHRIVAWDYAYRAARRGPWEQLARDRVRFRCRIEHMNKILGPILEDQHRRHMWQKFHAEAQNFL